MPARPSSSTPACDAAPKGAAQMSPRQGRPHRDPVKDRNPCAPGRLRLARPLLTKGWVASAKRDRSSAATRAPVSQAPDARLVRVVGLPSLLSREPKAAPACRPSRERDASRQSLQPTCCHEYPQGHATPKLQALALATAALLLVLRAGWGPSPRPEASLGGAGLPLLASPALGRPAQLVLRQPAAAEPSPLRGACGVPLWARPGIVNPYRARRPGSQTPHLATRSPCPASQARSARARTRFLASHQRVRLVEPEAPSTSKSHRR